MQTIAQRNEEIRKLREAGWSQRRIAKKFNVSRTTIYSICLALRHPRRKRSKEEIEVFRKHVSQDNDLDKQYEVSALMDALVPPTLSTRPVLLYFQTKNRQTISLREFFLLLVSDHPAPVRFEQLSPILYAQRLGMNGFGQIVDHIESLDLGQEANAEWERRLKILKEYRLSNSRARRGKR